MRVDLRAAGIEYRTSAGVANFHSLRAAYISDPMVDSRKVKSDRALRTTALPRAAQGKRASRDLPPDLAEVVAAWPALDEATRAAVLSLVRPPDRTIIDGQ
jgi:hypothetical protein